MIQHRQLVSLTGINKIRFNINSNSAHSFKKRLFTLLSFLEVPHISVANQKENMGRFYYQSFNIFIEMHTLSNSSLTLSSNLRISSILMLHHSSSKQKI
jgi:hypothetical protein